VGSLIGYLLGAYAAYWIIRNAVYGAMKDFEQWKRKRYGEPEKQ
jgi:membrane protein YqaA with SNARE-associated domain